MRNEVEKGSEEIGGGRVMSQRELMEGMGKENAMQINWIQSHLIIHYATPPTTKHHRNTSHISDNPPIIHHIISPNLAPED